MTYGTEPNPPHPFLPLSKGKQQNMASNTTTLPTYNPGDISWVLTSTAFVWLMIPGIGYFYSGLSRSKNALSLIIISVLSVAIVSVQVTFVPFSHLIPFDFTKSRCVIVLYALIDCDFRNTLNSCVQWFIWGYSLTFSETSSSPFIGDLTNAFFRGVNNSPSMGNPKIPGLAFAIFQSMFASLTPALAIGSAAERGRILPMTVFIFVWTTIVYDPIAYWSWNTNGWSKRLGGLDFAGGTPVHISSGAASLAYALILGQRTGDENDEFKPHNMSHVVLGTAFLWFGWFGFNGGSAEAGSISAAMACFVTNLSASVGGLAWMLMDYRLNHKFSAVGFCSGAIVGLVTITPAAGYVGPAPAIVFGVAGGIICNFACKLKLAFNYDDALDVFAVHGVGGLIGVLLTGVFADYRVVALDGPTTIAGGWINGHFIQILYQLADGCAGMSYSFVVTYIILFLMDKIPGLSLRVDIKTETNGIDASEMGESAYYHIDKLQGDPAVTEFTHTSS
ncbi:ammonium transporter AmtB-like domain-containing protein [Jimgerdemannia flammicorona]|uniref:Ammonium transporter n=1 Tax=Jimgerdemannia flammicorona TaxID=994334 RepID=A0A433QWA2_9FUNG|nr:ammonium transporter AmtB-like domain-containing protein [Jimgerdemannia flammicorona]